MKLVFKDRFLGECEDPFVRAVARFDGETKITLEFTRVTKRLDVETRTNHSVRFDLDIDSLACIGRTFIIAAKNAEEKMKERAEEAVDSLREVL
jgi:hypothetical protein